MYGRLIEFSGADPEKRDNAIQTIEGTVIPMLRQYDGFAGYIALYDAANRRAKAVLLWETEAAAEEAEQTRADARHIQHLQQLARKEKDVIKLNCVNDKLVQVKPQMNIADRAESDLETASDASRMAVFDQISQAAENVRRLREEADQCIGEPIQTGGDSSNSFTGPNAPDDPTKGFTGNEIEPPGYASPFD